MNVGAEPSAEHPIFEPGDTAMPLEDAEPVSSGDLVVSSDDGSGLPVHVGDELPAEQPTLEPGDELVYGLSGDDR